MKNSFRLFTMVLIISAVVVSCKKKEEPAPAPEPVNNNVNFYATLKGSNEVPSNASAATGTATANYDKVSKKLTVTTIFSGMTANNGHIHMGAPGVAGPVIFPFASTTSSIVFTSPKLDVSQEADLMAGNYYINLHSIAYPGGEIRGQLFQDNIVSFVADLKGTNEVPANASTATGTSYATFNKSSKVLKITTSYAGLTVTDAHLHNGDAGVAGPVVFPFTITATPILFTSGALNATQEADLMSHHYYVNLHSAAYPGGEIRGQLIKN